MYTDFASVYDRLMQDVPYKTWAQYYAGLLLQSGIRPGARCVECACGTGSLTIPLAQLGYAMTGVDQSREMLNLAQQKTGRSGVMIPFVRQDMRSLSVPRPVDAVLATCDGVNYLTGPGDAAAFFRAAHACLKPDGILAFDVSTPHKLSSVLGSQDFISSGSDLFYAWQGQYEEQDRLLRIHLDIFVRLPDGDYRRIEEDQCQRAHTADELTAWLRQAGFSRIDLFGDQVYTNPAPDALRWHLVAHKGDCI